MNAPVDVLFGASGGDHILKTIPTRSASGGRQNMALSGNGIRICRMSVEHSTTFPPHTHLSSQLTMVFEGEWIDEEPTCARVLVRGDVLFHPARTQHQSTAAAGSRIVLISVSPAVLAGFCPLYGNRPRSILKAFDDVDRIPERIDLELSRPDEATAVIVQSLVFQLIAIASRASTEAQGSHVPDWVARVVAYVNANLTERLIARRIAAVARISESHLTHTFRNYFHCGLQEYVRNCRLRAAARALRHESQSVKEIALDTGFADHAHFTRSFKIVYGVTPTDYRDNRIWTARTNVS